MRALLSYIYRHLKFFEELLTSISVALLFLTVMYIWMNFPLNFILEETCAKGTAAIVNFVGIKDDLPYHMDDVLFIDVSESSILVKDSLGTHAIADRSKLDTLFQLFRQHGSTKRLIVCDLYFDRPSAQDSSLQAAMAGFPNLISAVNTSADQGIIPNVFSAGTSGVSGFRVTKEPFLIFSNSLRKFSLTDRNCMKTLPLLMYERLHPHKDPVLCRWNALNIGEEWYLNTILINPLLEQDIPKAVYEDQVVPIQQLISSVKQQKQNGLNALWKKKFVMIGDFQGDLHKTTFGSKTGPLILFDVFLSLQMKENRISSWWMLLALTYFTLLLYKRFYHVNFFRKYGRMLNEGTRFIGFRRPLRFNWLLFYVFVLLSAILFRVYMEVVAGLVFFNLLVLMRVYIKTRRIRWQRLARDHEKVNVKSILSFLFKKPGFKH